MTHPDVTAELRARNRVVSALRNRFSLLEDKAPDEKIDERLRAGVHMQGTNLWVLMFAIFIASVGLNINSAAVIIGAMLISPLMGPIMGIGYGAGTYDSALIRTSLKNLAIAAALALLVSTVYFLLSPLRIAQSELLARTSPTLWDVLIAVFGGLAGIVGATRREKSNVIPGVAIATALMPPLCTAGFGLATGNRDYFLGALYLFTINCVFIATSTAIVVRAFRLPQKHFVDDATARSVHVRMGLVVLLTLLPSGFLAYKLVQQEVFKSAAAQFVQRQLEFTNSHVVNTTIDAANRRIEVTLVGDVVPPPTLAEVESRLPAEGLTGAELKVYQTGDQHVDVAALKTNLLADLYKQGQVASEEKDKVIARLQGELSAHEAERHRFENVPSELHALYPAVDNVLLTESPDWRAEGGWNPTPALTATLHAKSRISRTDQRRIEEWLKARLKVDDVRVAIAIGH